MQGFQVLASLKANDTPFYGEPSWKYPYFISGTPETVLIGGRLHYYDYDFTTISGDIAFTDNPASYSGVNMGFTVNARPISTTATGWQSPGGGSDYHVTVDTFGNGTPGAAFHIPDLTVQRAWLWSATVMEPGGLYAGDPLADTTARCGPEVDVIVTRSGFRRRSMNIAPPLHQRQRTDGLGGGPPHAGRNLNSRQLSGFGRGTL